MTTQAPAHEIHYALAAADIEYSGLSWGGFNIFGDRKSIEEVKRLQHLADTVPHLQAELMKARAFGEKVGEK